MLTLDGASLLGVVLLNKNFQSILYWLFGYLSSTFHLPTFNFFHTEIKNVFRMLMLNVDID